MREIKDCNVAVIGGAGFLGSHLVDYLISQRRCRVVVVDNLCVGRREFVNKEAIFHHHDITGSEDHLRSVFKEYQISYVFNYAAHPYIPDSFRRPIHVADVNFFGAMKVINAAQEAGCEGILQVSSAEIYGMGDAFVKHSVLQTPIKSENFMDRDKRIYCVSMEAIGEESPIVPHSSYGASKAAVDFFVQASWKERSTPCIALRQFNCVGERETHPYVVPEIISQLAEAKRREPKLMWPREIRLGNNSSRDFMYAGDAVRMAVSLLEYGEFGEVYNLGSEQSIKIYELAELIGQIMKIPAKVIEDPARKRPWEIWHLQSDNTKIYKAAPERPSTTLPEALQLTVNNFIANGSRWCWED